MGLMIMIMIALFGNLWMLMIAFFENLCMNGIDDNDNDPILWEPVHEWG